MITLAQFFKGRDKLFPNDLTPEIQENAVVTVEKGNALLARFYAANPKARQRGCNSGWRPPALNATTPGASKKSNHMLGKAEDIEDADRELSRWIMTADGQAALEEIELWIEDPTATPTWLHIQTVPPKSGRRVYMP